MQTDTLGRRKRSKPQSTGVNLQVTENDLKILLALQRHKLVPSSILHFYHGATAHKNSADRLTRLTHEKPSGLKMPLIHRPEGWMDTQRSLSNFGVYQLTKAGEMYLADLGYTETSTLYRSNSFPHDMVVGAITSSIQLAAEARGHEYIPGGYILARANANLTWQTLRPDQLFALKAPDGSYTAYMVEFTRTVEQTSSTNKSHGRKTYEDNIRLYKEFVGGKLYKEHYGLNCPMKVLNVINGPGQMYAMQQFIEKSSYMLFKTVEGFGPGFRVANYMPEMFNEPWDRVGYEPYEMAT